jgi:hypothetical protein
LHSHQSSSSCAACTQRAPCLHRRCQRASRQSVSKHSCWTTRHSATVVGLQVPLLSAHGAPSDSVVLALASSLQRRIQNRPALPAERLAAVLHLCIRWLKRRYFYRYYRFCYLLLSQNQQLFPWLQTQGCLVAWYRCAQCGVHAGVQVRILPA